jgi:DNA-binding beta-propeller fold protein YncE
MMGDGRLNGFPDLLPTADSKALLVHLRFRVMKLGTDGSLASAGLRPLITAPPTQEGKRHQGAVRHELAGPFFCARSRDGKHFYVSGLFHMLRMYAKPIKVFGEGFWRDGSVWKVDARTGKAEVFYSMPKGEVLTDERARAKSPIGSNSRRSYSAFHGVATDAEDRVFVCDRQHGRLLVIGADRKVLRQIPVKYPDAVAVSPEGRGVYVTTRTGSHHKPGRVRLLKFADWRKDKAPIVSLDLCNVGYEYNRGCRSLLLAAKRKGGGVNVWVTYRSLPVHVYRDEGRRLKLLRDFCAAPRERCLDLQRIVIDTATGAVYVPGGFRRIFRVADWKKPEFELCRDKGGASVPAASAAIDARRRFIYCRDNHMKAPGWSGPIRRYRLGDRFLAPAGAGKSGSNAVTGNVHCPHWHIFWGEGDRGLAVAPDGNLLTSDGPYTKAYGLGVLRWFKSDPSRAPWTPRPLKITGPLGGVRFDPRGNLYVGVRERPGSVPAIFRKDKTYLRTVGRIRKYAPTGSLAAGDLYPSPPTKPVTYDVNYGAFGVQFNRTPRFGVDGWGRVYYPTSLAQRVGVIDNRGNRIVRFGTYGNRDSMGGLPGDLVPTKDIPMAYPNSVDVDDNYIYVGDMANCRLLRIARTFAASETVDVK